MTATPEAVLIKDALVFLFSASILVPLFRRAHVPSVIGFVLAGILLGPHGLRQLAGDIPALHWITITDTHTAEPFAELGVLFLLFLLGLELSFERLWALRRVVFGAGALQALVSAVGIATVAYALGLSAPAAAVVGLALALSSTAIVMQLLVEEHRAAGATGRTALGILLFQDLLVAPILIFVGFAARDDAASLAAIIFEALLDGTLAVVGLVIAGRFLLRPVLRLAAHAGRDVLMASTMGVIVGAAVITASAQLSVALGAFLAGIFLGETEFKHQTEVDLEPFKGILLGLFFMGVGMTLDLDVIGAQLPAVLGGVAALLALKALAAALASRLAVGVPAVSIESAALLAPAGEFAFVILSTATAGGVVDSGTGQYCGAVAGLSMLSIPLLNRVGVRWGERAAGRGSEAAPSLPQREDYAELEGHVILAGFGRVGYSIASILNSESVELVALDRSPLRVSRMHQRGWKVYLGDAARPEILVRAGISRAALFIVTVDDPASAEAIVRAARSYVPCPPILARARDAEHAGRLLDAGASFVIPDAIEAGLQLAGRALTEFGYETESVRDRLACEREAAYRAGVDAASARAAD